MFIHWGTLSTVRSKPRSADPQLDPDDKFSVLWATCVVLALSGAVPMLLIIANHPVPSNGPWPAALLVACLAGLRYGLLVGQGQRRLYALITWLFVYVFLGIAPMVQMRSNKYPTTTPNILTELNLTAIGIVSVGVGAWMIGHLWHGSRQSDAVMPRRVHSVRVYIIAALSLAFGWYFITKVGLEAMFVYRSERSTAREAIWPNPATAAFVNAMSSMSLLVAVIALLQLRRQLPGPKPAILNVTLTGAIATLAMVVNPVSSPRFVFGTAILAVIATLGAFSTPRRFRITALSVIAALVLVFPAADAFRNRGTGLFSDGGPTQSLTTADYDAFAQLNNTVDYTRSRGVTNGRQALGVALFWVPRAAWPGKPVDTGVLLAEYRGYRFTNLSSSLWGELFINGSWLALIFGMGGLGWGSRRWDERMSSFAGLGVRATILPFYLLFLLRGSLLQAAAFFVVIVVLSTFVEERSSSRVGIEGLRDRSPDRELYADDGNHALVAKGPSPSG